MKRSALPVLGTAQLGLSYGVANRVGKPEQRAATEIVKEAWQLGIREFDTAQAYGDSESTLGKALADLELSTEAKIIPNPHPDLDHKNADLILRSLNNSLKKISIPRFFCVMLHREEMLSNWRHGVSKSVETLVKSGLTQYIGISVYSPEKAITALKNPDFSMVQVPSNILDRRFEEAGVFEIALDRRKTIYIRSAFLQGLILLNPDEMPEFLSFAKITVTKLHELAQIYDVTVIEMALGYLKEMMPSAKIVFGAETSRQVKENFIAWQKGIPRQMANEIRAMFKDVDERILNPTLWK